MNDETGVQLLTVMRTVYTRQITRVMMLVVTRVSYFKFELIHVHAGCNVTQREYLKFVSAMLVHI